MANTRKKIEKKIKKNNEMTTENEKKINSSITNVKNGFKIGFGIFVSILFVIILTNIINGTYIFNDNGSEVAISTSEIVAGQTFNKQSGTYYVAYYDFSSSDEDLSTTISSVSGNNNVYKVDLSNGFNKYVISSSSNSKVATAADLKISDVTIIKINDGKNIEYVEGYDNCVTYLKTIK